MNIPSLNNGNAASRQTIMNNRPLGEGVMPEPPEPQATLADTYTPSPLAANDTQSTMPEPIASINSPVGGMSISERATDTAEIKRQDRLFNQATQNNMIENLRNSREANQGTGRLLDMIV